MKTFRDFGQDYFEMCENERGTNHDMLGEWQYLFARMLKTLPCSKQKVLDIGCAKGAIAEAMRQTFGGEVHGTDMKWPIQDSQEKNLFPQLKLIPGSAATLKGCDKDYDFMMSSEVVGHLVEKDQEKVAKAWNSHLKMNGIVFLTYECIEKPERDGDGPWSGVELQIPNDDPTHIGYRPQRYWLKQFLKNGFIRKPEFEEIIKKEKFYKQYKWNILIFEKVEDAGKRTKKFSE